jgi:histone deacetylase complex subunit SAP18
MHSYLLFRLDATLKELTGLVKEVNPDARRKGTYFDFAIVYPDQRSPVYRLREIGTVSAGQRGADDSVSLASKRFNIGDYIDIAISPPRPGGPPPGRRPRPY